MKKLALMLTSLVVATTLQADTLMGTFTGQLRGSDTKDVQTLDLQRGQYRYELELSGDKRARAKFKVTQRRLTGIRKHLVTAEKLKSGQTHTGTFNIEVRGVVGQNTQGTREARFVVKKKAGPRKIIYTLKVYKK